MSFDFNFIHLSKDGIILDRNIKRLVMGSSGVDLLYIISDFDTESGQTPYRCSIRFKRSDKMLLGPFLAPQTIIPQELKERLNVGYDYCRVYIFESKELEESGPLNLTFAYQTIDEQGNVLTTRTQGEVVFNVAQATPKLAQEDEVNRWRSEFLPRDFGDLSLIEAVEETDVFSIRQGNETKKISASELKANFNREVREDLNNITIQVNSNSVNITNLTDDIKSLVEDGVIQGIIETDIENKLNQLETNYSPRLTNVEKDVGQQIGFKDSYIKKNDVSPKLVYNQNGSIFVVTQKPSKKEYIRFRLQDGVYTTVESEGRNAEFLRINQVLTTKECFVYVSKKKQVSDPLVWSNNIINYVSPIVGSSVPISCDVLTTKTSDAWVEYEAEVPFGINEVIAFVYGSSGSSDSVTISINGIDVLNGVSFKKDTNGFFFLNIPVLSSGKHTIRFTTTTPSFMTIAGVNVVKLKDFNDGFNFDNYVVVHQTDVNQYVQSNGSMDYALLKEDGIWTGSYHGGEIRSRLLFMADNEEVAINNGDVFVCNIFEVIQDTRISGKIDAHSRQTFAEDSTRDLEVIFNNGSINLKRMFVNMSTTLDSYDDIIYPINYKISGTGNKYLPSGINVVIQKNPINNQKAITILNNNMLPYDKRPLPFIKKVVGAYNKVYNANIDVDDGHINFTGGNYKVVHSFE